MTKDVSDEFFDPSWAFYYIECHVPGWNKLCGCLYPTGESHDEFIVKMQESEVDVRWEVVMRPVRPIA